MNKILFLIYLSFCSCSITTRKAKDMSHVVVDRLNISEQQFLSDTFRISTFSKVSSISLKGKYSNTHLRALLDSLSCIDSLKEIHLRDQGLLEIPEGVFKLCSLEQLDLGLNKLSDVPKKIDRLINLRQIDLSWNEFQYMPKAIESLTMLEVLILDRNPNIDQNAMFSSLCKLKNLNELSLYDNNYFYLSDSIFCLSELKVLDLGRNKLILLPKDLSRFKSLKILNLGGNMISVPERRRITQELPNVQIKFDLLLE